MIITQTKRLTIRTLEISDAEFYLTLVNDPSFIQNIRDKGIRTIIAAQEAIEKDHITIQEQRGFSFYLIEKTVDHTSIGICGFVKREELPDVDIGYAFLPAHWGQGYAFEAANELVQYAKDQLQLPRLLGFTSPDNLASSKLLEKIGLTFESDLPWKDEAPVKLYSLNFK